MKINNMASNNSTIETKTKGPIQQVQEATPIEQHIEKQQEIRNLEAEEKQKKVVTKEEAEHIVNGINEFFQAKYTSLSFKMHEEADRYYVEVVDQETKKVLREIPDKELLDLYAKMTDFLGVFIDKKL